MAAEQNENGVGFFQLLGILWRGKLVIAFCCVVLTSLGTYYAFELTNPRFSATARIALEVRQPQVVDLESVVSGVSTETAALNTEIEFIRSFDTIGRVVDALNLVEQPYLNRTLQQEPDFSVAKLRRALRDLIVGPPPAPRQPSPAEIRQAVINNTRAAVSVTTQRNTYIFNIRATTDSGALSTLIVNAVAEAYIESQVEKKFSATEYAVSLLSERVTELEQELKVREEELQEFRGETELVSLESLAALNLRGNSLRDRLDDSLSEISQLQSALADANAVILSDDQAAIAAHFEDRILTQVLDQIADGADGSLFNARVATLMQNLEAEIERAEVQRATLQTALMELEIQRSTQNQDLVRINEMMRNIQATSVLYETFLTRLKETSAQLGLQTSDATVLSLAQRGVQIAPRRARLVAMSFIIGIAFGAGVVLLRQFTQFGFRLVSEVENETGLPVLGQVPKVPIRNRAGLLPFLSENPTSAAAEAVRNLRTSILMSRIDDPPKLIMCTSSLPGEGKTTTSMALSQNLAGLGKRVILIEGDIRRRAFQNYVQSRNKAGLFSVISGEARLDDVKIYDEILGVDVLLGEKTSMNAADVFSSNKFEQFVSHLRETYEYIVIDTPPVLVVPDARIIGQLCDAIVFAIKWDSTHKEQVADGLRELQSVGLTPTGLVLTQVDERGLQRYGYGGRYGAYAAYGKNYYGT